MRSRYDPLSQKTVFARSQRNKRSHEAIAEIDAELICRGNRIRGSYHPLQQVLEDDEGAEALEGCEIDNERNPLDTEDAKKTT